MYIIVYYICSSSIHYNRFGDNIEDNNIKAKAKRFHESESMNEADYKPKLSTQRRVEDSAGNKFTLFHIRLHSILLIVLYFAHVCW